MQTYSHFILTAALNGRLAPRLRAARLPPLRTGALFLGSVLPDLPLIGISIYTIAYDILTGAFARADFSAAPLGAPPPGAPPPELLDISMTMRLFDVWFYENPAVLTAHNLFHGPLPVALFLFAGWWGWRHGRRWGAVLFWLSAAAMLHALIDIPLHATDGPLLFFPVNWTYRFRSPISYWDPDYYGRQWSIFEHLFDLLLLIYLYFRYRPLKILYRNSR
jgi:hypothetical protein